MFVLSCTSSLLEVPPEIMGDDVIISNFWVDRQDDTLQTPSKRLRVDRRAFQSTWKGCFGALSLSQAYLQCLLLQNISVAGSRCLRVPQVPTETTSSTTGKVMEKGFSTVFFLPFWFFSCKDLKIKMCEWVLHHISLYLLLAVALSSHLLTISMRIRLSSICIIQKLYCMKDMKEQYRKPWAGPKSQCHLIGIGCFQLNTAI